MQKLQRRPLMPGRHSANISLLRVRRTCVAAILGMVWTGCGAPETVEPTSSEPVEFTSNTISDLAEDAVDAGLPGVIILIDGPRGRQIEAAGMADVEAATAMTTDARFRIASNTKSFVGLALAVLDVQGTVDLDSVASTFLPDHYTDRLENLEGATIRQLLNHSSGIYDYLASDGFAAAVDSDPSHTWSDGEVIEYAFDQPASFPLGQGWEYSNTNYILAGMVIDSVTGNHHSATIREHIFTPLEMNDSFYENEEEATGPIVHGYVPDDGELFDMHSYNTGFGMADGGIVSTAEDVAVYIRALGGSDSQLSSEAVGLMLDDAVSLEDGEVYGLGITRYETDDGPALGHGGNIEGYSSDMFLFTQQGVVVVVMTNGSDGDLDAIYEAVVDRAVSLAMTL